jgi:NAD(P)-dependent dehydrogenase (short-subunit alcohol dehydrogenase family)
MSTCPDTCLVSANNGKNCCWSYTELCWAALCERRLKGWHLGAVVSYDRDGFDHRLDASAILVSWLYSLSMERIMTAMKIIKATLVVTLLLVTQGVYGAPQTVLITGANRGVGLALAQTFKQRGYQVIATARKPEKAQALKALGIQIEQLDVVSAKSVARLAATLKGQRIDVLLNNAGISGHHAASFAQLDVEQLKQVFDVNGLGALRVTQALLGNMQDSRQKVVANISSIMGSTGLNERGGLLGYRASKAALNNFTKSLALEYGKSGYVFVVLHPGWVRTDMGSDRATYSSEESAAGLFEVIAGLGAQDNGAYYDFQGKTLAW